MFIFLCFDPEKNYSSFVFVFVFHVYYLDFHSASFWQIFGTFLTANTCSVYTPRGLCCTCTCLQHSTWARVEPGCVYTTEATAASGRVYTIGPVLHLDLSGNRSLC
jgi:hypothetical protein